MRVLVTGGAGLIGSHVVDAYVAAGHDVVVVDDLSHGKRENINLEARCYEIDIRDPDLADVFDEVRPDAVNHHAAQMDVRRSTAEPVFDADVNVLGSLNVLQNAIRTGVRRVLYASTGGAVYGEPQRLPVDEGHPIRPLCEYGASKFIVERYLYMYGENYDLDWTVLRYPNVYGPRQDPVGEAGVVAVFASRMLRNEPCTINGDGDQERDFVYVGDCVRANEILLDGSGSRRVYNLGSGGPTTINRLFESLAVETGYQLPPIYGPPKLGETYRIYLDAGRAKDELGWQPKVALEEGLSATVAHFRGLQAGELSPTPSPSVGR